MGRQINKVGGAKITSWSPLSTSSSVHFSTPQGPPSPESQSNVLKISPFLFTVFFFPLIYILVLLIPPYFNIPPIPSAPINWFQFSNFASFFFNWCNPKFSTFLHLHLILNNKNPPSAGYSFPAVLRRPLLQVPSAHWTDRRLDSVFFSSWAYIEFIVYLCVSRIFVSTLNYSAKISFFSLMLEIFFPFFNFSGAFFCTL